MDRIEQIEAAIDGLPPEEYRRIAEWFRAREQARWMNKWIGILRLASWISCSPKPRAKPRRSLFANGRREGDLGSP
jgi:hypothetical protein